MLDAHDKVLAARDFLYTRLQVQPRVGIVLGSGLGILAGEVEDVRTVAYDQVPYWPTGSVPGHKGELVAGRMAGTATAILSGRVHLYEGFSAEQVVFGVRVLGSMRVRTLILTNASGVLNEGWEPGKLALLSDHINLQGTNPLIGPGAARFGPLFPDLSEPYDAKSRRLAHRAGAPDLELFEGVYAAVLGPNYETPAEVRYLRAAGADMVGMSTVQETIAARQIGMRVLGISVLTNFAAGLGEGKLSHDHVLAAGERASNSLARLLKELLPKLPTELDGTS